jgi:AraC-like DNA-binding protein
VQVVVHLPSALLSHLRVVLSREHVVRTADSWIEVEEIVRRHAVDVAVVDPTAEGTTGAESIRQLIARHPSLPLVVYTSLSPQALKAVVTLARHGVEHVVLHRFDDDPRRFLALIERLPGYALGELLLERLAEPMGKLPLSVSRAIERLVRSPGQFFGTADLASAAGVTVRTLYRQLDAAGLASPRLVVQGARILRAYSYLQDRGTQLDNVSAKLGYSAPRILSRQIQQWSGLTPSELRHRVVPEAFVRTLVRRLRRGD